MARLFMWNDLEDPVDADALEEVATAIHWACIDVSEVDRPVLQKWAALDTALQVCGTSEQVHSALDRSSHASRSMAGTGYRLEKILYSYAQAARAHAENRAALGDEVGEYHDAVNLHRDDPAWERRLEDWFERLQLWKQQVNEEYAENDENCHRALRNYLDGGLTTLEYGFPRGPRPEGEDRVVDPGSPTPEDGERFPDVQLIADPPRFGGDDPYAPHCPRIEDPPRAEVPRVEVPERPRFELPDERLRTLPAYPDAGPDRPQLGGSDGEGESGGSGRVQLGAPEPDDDSGGTGRVRLGSVEEDDDAVGSSGKLTLSPIEPDDDPVRGSGKLRLVPIEDEDQAVGGVGRLSLGPTEPDGDDGAPGIDALPLGAVDPHELPQPDRAGGTPLGGTQAEEPPMDGEPGADFDTGPGLALGGAGATVAGAAAFAAAKSR